MMAEQNDPGGWNIIDIIPQVMGRSWTAFIHIHLLFQKTPVKPISNSKKYTPA